ncbi:hypothetical protein MNBD_GAMMA24-1759 [hydrothermal vent metagenome]|uniref:DUF4878 domain-containing protein n=1 Tax=hydrothermal vent metagenome TaxID=652676 RepID=A0A3B1B355_9ZZZZ
MKNIGKNLGLISLMGFFLLLGGCAGSNGKTNSFDSTTRAYEQLIRWGDLEKTNDFLQKPAEFSAARHEKLKNIQVTSYRVLGRTITKEGIEQVVEIKYTKDASVVVRTLTDVQKWHYDENDERWYLTSKIPQFK